LTNSLNSNLKHEVFNIGGGPRNTLSLLELLDVLEEQTEKEAHIKFADWRQADQKVYISDISRVRSVLNWEPKVSPREGVERLIDWVSRNMGLFVVR